MEKSPTDKRIDDLSDRIGRFEENVDQKFDEVDRRFDRFEDKVDAPFEKVDADAKERPAKSEATIGSLGEKIDKMNRWMMSGLFTIVGAVIIKLFVA
jgi:hypothetical protein